MENTFANFHSSSTNAPIIWNFSNFAGHLLDTGANIQYAASNGPIPDMVLVSRHRVARSLLFPSFLFDRFAGGVAHLRIHHSEGEKGET